MKLTPLPLTVWAITQVGSSGLVRHRGQGRLDGRHVVAVDLAGCPAERRPLGREGIEVQHVFAAAKALNLVVIDHRHQVFQAVMAGKQHGFPGRALVALAVAEEDEDPVRPPIAAGGQGQAAADGQAVPQRAVETSTPGIPDAVMCPARRAPFW